MMSRTDADHIVRPIAGKHAARECVDVSANVRIETGSDGEMRVVKSGAGPSEVSVRAEAAMLRRVRGPGVVAIVDSRELPDGFEFATSWIGNRSLADMARPMSANRAAGFCLAIGATLQRIHGSGVVHNHVDPSHVLLDDHGRPTLCGFGSSTADGRSARADVVALAALVVDLLSDDELDRKQPSPDRSGRRSDRHRLLRSLQPIADEALEPIPDLEQLLGTVRKLAPEATLGLAPRSASAASRPSERRTVKVASAVGIAMAAALVVGFTATRWPTTKADPAGFGPEPTTLQGRPQPVGDAPTVTLDGSLFRIGRAGDIAVARSIDCEADTSVYVLRPETEMLYVFDSIATLGHDTSPSSESKRSGAVSIEPTVDPFTGCDALAIGFADGHRENFTKSGK